MWPNAKLCSEAATGKTDEAGGGGGGGGGLFLQGGDVSEIEILVGQTTELEQIVAWPPDKCGV